MILIIAGTLIGGIVGGIVWERYRWVRACKNRRVVEVDGYLYGVHKVIPKIPAE